MIDLNSLLEKVSGLLGESSASELLENTDAESLMQDIGIDTEILGASGEQLTEMFSQTKN